MGTKKLPSVRPVQKSKRPRESTEDDQPMPGWKRVPRIARVAINTILDTIDRRQHIRGLFGYEKDKGK